MPLHPRTPSSLASFKSKLVLPFWYRLTQVVLEKRLLNGCCCCITVEVVMQNFAKSEYPFVLKFSSIHMLVLTALFSGTIRVSQYQKDKTKLDFTEARDSEWQWHQLAICKSAPRSSQITMPEPHHSVFLQARCPSCCPVTV